MIEPPLRIAMLARSARVEGLADFGGEVQRVAVLGAPPAVRADIAFCPGPP